MNSYDYNNSSMVPVAESVEQPRTQSGSIRTYGLPDLVSACLIVAANVFVATGGRWPFIGPAIGFWFLVVHPVYILYTTSFWRGSSVAERIAYCLTAVLLLLMLAGLGMNAFLPFLGVQRPLDAVPVLILGDILNVLVYLVRLRHPAKIIWRVQLRTIMPKETRLIICSGLCTALAVLGANRLNNGAGDELTIAALGFAVVTVILVLLWNGQVRDGTISATLYLLSAALLLITSLRGWYITGHDIQGEYQVFQLTDARGRWSIADYRSTYNACLSITILPTEIAHVVQVYSPYVYKVFFQLIFALCPVLIYTIARRNWRKSYAILAVVYFIGFPTFVNDMPFLNRQEISFLFVCVAILAVTNVWWGPRRRRLVFFLAAIGVELSHYSTMYVFLGTLFIAWAAQKAIMLIRRRRDRPMHRRNGKRTSWAVMARTVGIGSILVVAGIALLWGGLVTQTAGSAFTDAETSISGFVIGNPPGARSSDVTYSIFGGESQSPQSLLNSYRQETLEYRAANPSIYLPASTVARYTTPIANQPSLPLTWTGRLLSRIGIPVAGLNNLVRAAAAKGEQLFAAIGLISIAVARRFRRRMSREIFYFCIGSIFMVGLVTVLPDLSVDYGVLRAFQEALILIAPVLVVGSIITFRPLGEFWASRIAEFVCVLIFFSTTGLLPQLTGDYPAQLGLNNSGLYYDLYYMHAQEVTAVGWLSRQPNVSTVLENGVQAEDFTFRFAFMSPPSVPPEEIQDIYPTLITRSSWVIVNYAILHTGRAATVYNGDALIYEYPLQLLEVSKNLVYNDGGAEIYK
jgi:uncharacterized membrane protein